MPLGEETPTGRAPQTLTGPLLAFCCVAGVLLAHGRHDYPNLHTILDTGAALLSSVLALSFLDMSNRLLDPFLKRLAAVFAVTFILEALHVAVVIEWFGRLDFVETSAIVLRPSTWPPASYLLPFGVLLAMAMRRKPSRSARNLGFALTIGGILIAVLASKIPRYTDPKALGVTRPALALVPILWTAVAAAAWRLRSQNRMIRRFVLPALVLLLGNVSMLYSLAPHDTQAMVAHAGKVTGYLILLLSTMQLASFDMLQKIRAEEALEGLNQQLERRIANRTEELTLSNTSLQAEVAERRKAEQQLRVSEARYSMLAEALPAIVFIAAPAGQVEYVNQRWMEYTGLGPDSPIDRANLVHPDDIMRIVQLRVASIQSSLPYDVELRLKRHDGLYRWFHVRATPVFDEDGHVLKWIGVATDIDDEKQSQERLRDSQKLEALGRLAGGVAHDFNNLLTGISGYNSLAMDELEDRPRLLAYLGQVKGAADRAAALTRQLLAFSRRQVAQPKVINLNKVVEDVSKLLQRVIGEDIQMNTMLADDLWPIKVDPIQVDQIIMNLAVNARDAMPGGGRFTIDTANVVVAETTNRSGIPAGEFVELILSDTGVGMNAETKSRLFEPFFTTKEQGKGTGLGLSIVYGVVAQNGGYIEVESEPGQGASFRIYFPRCSGGEGFEDSIAVGEPAKCDETILLVEDEQTVRTLVATMLRQRGFKVLEAATPEDAVRIARDNVPIDALLSDVLMPQMRGPELARRVRESRPGIPVVFMSGYSDRTFLDPAALTEATYLQKPFTVDQLTATIRKALDERASR